MPSVAGTGSAGRSDGCEFIIEIVVTVFEDVF